jgi:hypothetical protein
LGFADDAEGLGVDELIDESAAFDGAVFVEDVSGHVLDVIVERVAESDHFDDGREEHEEDRQWIADDDDELLVEDGGEAAKEFHAATPVSSRSVVSATKTSSSDGPIGRISASRMPTWARLWRIVSSESVLSTSRCIDWPKTVALRMPGRRRNA